LLLRTVEGSETAVPSVARLRSKHPGRVGGRSQRAWRALVHMPRPTATLLLMLFLAWALRAPQARAQAETSPETAQSSAWRLAKADPHALVQAAIENELKDSYGHRAPVRYLLRKKTRNTDTTKEIVETHEGGVARLVANHGQPLTPTQLQTELQRLRDLASNPTAQQHRRHNEERDAGRIAGVMRLLPDAYTNQYQGPVQTPGGTAIRLTFSPNPHFSPPTLESRLLTGIQGEIWIDPTDLRVVRIEGHLFREVEYGWGILGTLYPGGTIRIDQSKTTECGWQLARLDLNMTGKELMLKSLRVVVEEEATNYRPVHAGWKYSDAIEWLLHMPETLAAESNR
jgi:hypothetical protein